MSSVAINGLSWRAVRSSADRNFGEELGYLSRKYETLPGWQILVQAMEQEDCLPYLSSLGIKRYSLDVVKAKLAPHPEHY